MLVVYMLIVLTWLGGVAQASVDPNANVYNTFPNLRAQSYQLVVPTSCVEPLVFGTITWMYYTFVEANPKRRPDLKKTVVKTLVCVGESQH